MNYLSMQTTKLAQAQVMESLLRMRILELHENAIEEFKNEGRLNKSELGGLLFGLEEHEEKMVRDWERETGNIVYHVLKNYTNFGLHYSFLYVSQDSDEWEMDNDDLKSGYPIVYVKNVNDDSKSEYGSIVIKPQRGGIKRTA